MRSSSTSKPAGQNHKKPVGRNENAQSQPFIIEHKIKKTNRDSSLFLKPARLWFWQSDRFIFPLRRQGRRFLNGRYVWLVWLLLLGVINIDRGKMIVIRAPHYLSLGINVSLIFSTCSVTRQTQPATSAPPEMDTTFSSSCPCSTTFCKLYS